MELNPEDISEILRIFADSDLEELHLDVEGTRLDLSKSAGALTRTVPVARPAPARSAPIVPPDSVADQATTLTAAPGTAPTGPADGGVSAASGLHELTAPVLGVFYRRPAPGQAPFVEVGVEVGPEDSVCVVDVMKMFTRVTAGIAGRIAEICVEDGELVEHGQVLMRIEPR